MRVLAMLLGLAVVLLGVAVGVHDLALKHTSRTIEALALGLVLAGVAVIALANTYSRGRS